MYEQLLGFTVPWVISCFSFRKSFMGSLLVPQLHSDFSYISFAPALSLLQFMIKKVSQQVMHCQLAGISTVAPCLSSIWRPPPLCLLFYPQALQLFILGYYCFHLFHFSSSSYSCSKTLVSSMRFICAFCIHLLLLIRLQYSPLQIIFWICDPVVLTL